jgi:hypothetical protein
VAIMTMIQFMLTKFIINVEGDEIILRPHVRMEWKV